MGTKRLRKMLVKKTSGKCFYCGKSVSFKRKKKSEKATIDHYIPKSKGGKNGKSNLVACCLECNRQKGNLLPENFQSAKAK